MESIWSGAIPPRAITKRPALPTMTADSWGVGPFETASWGEVFPTVILAIPDVSGAQLV